MVELSEAGGKIGTGSALFRKLAEIKDCEDVKKKRGDWLKEFFVLRSCMEASVQGVVGRAYTDDIFMLGISRRKSLMFEGAIYYNQ